MIPAYNAEQFQSLDLRKYHVRDMKDVIRFIDFSQTRLDECKHILNKFSTRYSTLEAVVKQMKSQQQKINNLYGAPGTATADAPAVPEDRKKAVIQESNESINLQQERESLLDDLRQAQAEENLAEVVSKSDDVEKALRAEFDKYKATYNEKANRIMYYREGKLLSAKDVPEDIKAMLEEAIRGQGESI